jgi:hypothetical protein
VREISSAGCRLDCKEGVRIMRCALWLLLALLICATATCPAQCETADIVKLDLTIHGYLFEVGEPIPYELKVSNISRHDVWYMNTNLPDWSGNWATVACAESGKLVPRPYRGTVFVSFTYSYAKLKPGKPLICKGFVNKGALLNRPGSYVVTAGWSGGNMLEVSRHHQFTSPPVTIRIVESTADSRLQRIEAARSMLASAESDDERRKAIILLGYTTDTRALPDLAEAARDRKLWGTAKDGMLRFPPEAILSAIDADMERGGPSEYLTWVRSDAERARERQVQD